MSARAARQRIASQVEPMRELEKLIRTTSYRHQVHAVFRDFVEMAAISMSNAVDLGPKREPREARYLQIAGRYTREELAAFPKMLGCLVEALEGEMHDALGKLFMALELGNHWVGQFFTPYELARLMAQMMFHDAIDRVRSRGYVTMAEPAAGAGCMVIACAEALREQGVNYQQALHVTAQDLDETAALMCYVQMALLHIPGVVVVGNTLTMEERDRWYTPAHILGGWSMRLCARRTEDFKGAEVNGEPAAVEEVPPAAAVPPAVEPTGIPSVGSGSGTAQLDLFGGAA